MRLGGSGAFGNAARSVLLLDRDPDDPDGGEGKRRVLAHIKCNVSPLAPSLVYAVEPIALPATESDPEVETSRLELIGESPHNGRSLLAVASEEERSALDEAMDFLRTELIDGRRYPAGDIFREARKVGITDRTLKRARKSIGAETAKAGFGRGWEWWLPKGPSEARSSASLHEGSSVRDTAPSLAPSRGARNGHAPFPGDDDFLDHVAGAHGAGHITTGEALEREQSHRLVLRARAA
jgi:hypothetical protein